MDLSFVSKANVLERKANETKQNIEKLEETILEKKLEEKRKKMRIIINANSTNNANYNFCNYLHVLIFCCEIDGILFTTQEAITCSKPGKKTLKQCQKSWKKINFKLCVLYRISWDHWLSMETCKFETYRNFKTFLYCIGPQRAW